MRNKRVWSGRRLRWMVPLVLLGAGLMMMAGCSADSEPTRAVTGPAICQNLGEQTGLREAVINSVAHQVGASEAATFRAAAARLRESAPKAGQGLSLKLANAAEMLDSLAAGGTLSDRQVTSLSDVLQGFDEEVRRTCS